MAWSKINHGNDLTQANTVNEVREVIQKISSVVPWKEKSPETIRSVKISLNKIN